MWLNWLRGDQHILTVDTDLEALLAKAEAQA
jgi:hypothetical protein